MTDENEREPNGVKRETVMIIGAGEIEESGTETGGVVIGIIGIEIEIMIVTEIASVVVVAAKIAIVIGGETVVDLAALSEPLDSVALKNPTQIFAQIKPSTCVNNPKSMSISYKCLFSEAPKLFAL